MKPPSIDLDLGTIAITRKAAKPAAFSRSRPQSIAGVSAGAALTSRVPD
jgi:hypothetical protein